MRGEVSKSWNLKRSCRKKINLLRGVSNKWCEIINFQSGLCLKCLAVTKVICASLHLKNEHGIIIKDILDIWDEDICPITSESCKGKKVSRNKVMDEVLEALDQYVNEMQNAKVQLSDKENWT